MEKNTSNINTILPQNEGATWGFFTPNQTTNSEAGSQIVSSGSERNDTIASALTHTSDESTSVGVTKATPVTDEASEANDAKLILTTEQLLLELQKVTAQGKKLKQVWLGENLKLTFSKGQPAKFVFVRRVTFGPKSVDLGKYGKVVFEDVRASADEQNAAMKVQLLEEKETRLIQRQQAKAAQPKEKSFKNETGFSNKTQLMDFVNSIWSFVPNDEAYFKLKTLIQLQLLLPHRASELIKASVSDFDLYNSIWYIKKNNVEIEQDNEMLSKEAVEILENYFASNNISHADFINNKSLFQEFSLLNNERNNIFLNEFISKLSFDFEIVPSNFIYIFKYFSVRDSVYTEKFIDKIIKKNAFSPTELAYYSTQRWALMQWWSTNITNFVSAFERSSDSLLVKPVTFKKITTPSPTSPRSKNYYLQNIKTPAWQNEVVYPNIIDKSIFTST